ncbi:juvenile hormone esterase isoform X2 [Frankliniella occidentalis]|uniref:Carboxylic ester hydrolase n=1 Tax=Frankliniella occidentalis TaxID=133901 RepID=A0A9C6X3I7_FRAOC|nr:juvenile hormone esterase isoform X2 [Frankliniella occidentalis]
MTPPRVERDWGPPGDEIKMGSESKKRTPKRDNKSGGAGTVAQPSSSKWKTPLIMAALALGLYRATEYHNYWNSLSPVVEVQQGPVQGRSALTESGTEYFAFQGIPYAAPPVGPLRFQDPAPPASWAPEVRDARDDGPVCVQAPLKLPMGVPKNVSALDVVRFLGAVPALVRRAIKLTRQSEDCLHVNVFTTKVGGDGGSPLPVVVYFHGGAFVHGDNGVDVVGPQYMMEHGVVLVTAKYRLGPLGFLALGEAGKPLRVGNVGLKDAAAALRWVHDNIARFGGDPAKVTVMGQSAGGALAHYLTLMPSTKGLFHRVIAMSGTALHHWAYSTPQKALERTRHMVERLLRPEAAGGPHGPAAPDMEDPEDVLRFLREVDARHLAVMDNFGDGQEGRWLMDEFPFQPTMDGTLLSAPPLELIRAGRFHQVPVMLGLTAQEGFFAFMSAPAKNKSVEEQMAMVEADFYCALPEYMREALPRGSDALRKAEAAVREFYFGKSKITQSSLDQFVDFYGMLMFEMDTHRAMTEVSAVSTEPVFAYNFTHSGRLNLFRRMVMFSFEDFEGVSHCDELNYLFHMDALPHIPLQSTDPEFQVRKNIITLFTNFVKTGHPTPTSSSVPTRWRQVTKREKPVMQIDVLNKIQDGYKPASFKLWSKFYQDLKI